MKREHFVKVVEEALDTPPQEFRSRIRNVAVLVRRHIIYQNRNVTNATAKFLWERVERLLDYLDEMFTLHPSPTELNKGTLTPSSRRRLRRHHRHFLCRRLRLPLRLLPRRALVEGGHRQVPTDQKGLSRGILDVFCSCPMVRPIIEVVRHGTSHHFRRHLWSRKVIMIKLVYCITKKAGLTGEEFFRYWEDIHAPIGGRIPHLRTFVQGHRLVIPRRKQ